MNPIKRSQLIWATITNGTTAAGAFVNFPDQPELRGVVITAIESINEDDLAKTPDAINVIPSSDLVKCALSLFDGSNQRHRNIPCSTINTRTNAGIWRDLEPFKVNWQRSGVLILQGLAKDLNSIPFVVHYRFPRE